MLLCIGGEQHQQRVQDAIDAVLTVQPQPELAQAQKLLRELLGQAFVDRAWEWAKMRETHQHSFAYLEKKVGEKVKRRDEASSSSSSAAAAAAPAAAARQGATRPLPPWLTTVHQQRQQQQQHAAAHAGGGGGGTGGGAYYGGDNGQLETDIDPPPEDEDADFLGACECMFCAVRSVQDT